MARLSELREAYIDHVEGLVEEIRDGLVGVGEEAVEKVLRGREPEHPMTGWHCLTSWKFCPHHSAACFPACPLQWCQLNSCQGDLESFREGHSNPLEHCKVPLSLDPRVVIHKRVGILHSPSTPFIPIFTDADSESTS